jgi:methionyl-tRNA formyltransferase
MKVLFIGAVQFSYAVLQELLLIPEADVVGVCTLSQHHGHADHADLTLLARAANVPVVSNLHLHTPEVFEWIQSLQPDVIFCFGWSRLLKSKILNLAPLGVIGFHPAALPANRGRHPLIWALALGLKQTASTFFIMDEGADSGDIISQKIVAIYPSDDANALYQRITEIALTQLHDFVPNLAKGNYSRMRQNHAFSNNWRKRGMLDGEIDWRMPAVGIYNLVRALSRPYIGAHFLHQRREVKVWRCEPVICDLINIEPGKVIGVEDQAVLIKAGIDAVRLLDTMPKLSLNIGEYL